MKESFEGGVPLVTGAGSGIGLATANAFAGAGPSLVLADVMAIDNASHSAVFRGV
jgi:NAD(P)-dependent dehydrogenase (short-subunit alcohol dehydrogenase family)